MKMTLDRLRQIVDAYGVSPDRWPVEERAAACRLVADDPAAQAICTEAAPLDAALDAVVPAEPPAALRRRILATLDAGPMPAPRRDVRALLRLLFPSVPLWRPAAASALLFIAGIAVAAVVEASTPSTDDYDANALVEFGLALETGSFDNT